MPSLPPYIVRSTNTPLPSASGRCSASFISWGQLTEQALDNRPAAPTPALARRNLRRFTSGIGSSPSRRQVFGRVDGGGDQLSRPAHQRIQGLDWPVCP